MQVKLLRDLINDALNEPNEQTRIGSFWCFAEDYDEYVPIIKDIFYKEELEEIKSEEFNIKRLGDAFLINDKHGQKDIFTIDEIKLLIYLWDQSFEVKPNVIQL